MTDSIRVFDPGYRVTDQNGALVPGALIKFYSAGTNSPLTVYSNPGLSTALGSTVTCDAYGSPISGGGTNTLIYTGTADFRVVLQTSAGVLIPGLDYDPVAGALDTSGYNTVATVEWPVVPISSTGTIADLAQVENVNPTAGQITRTLPTAASAGNGAYLFVRHDGTANSVLVASQGSDLIHMRGDLGSRQTLPLWEKGDAALLVADGADLHALFTPPIERGKLWIVKAQASAPPSSPVAGDAYILTGTPTGAWSTFAANDIATSDGNAGWIRSRPSTDCGWVAFQQDDGLYRRFIGSAWRSESASDTTYGTLTVATQSDQETATSLTAAVTPGRQHLHPSAAKAWVGFDGTGTVAIKASYNVSSITDNGTGDYTINRTVPFSSEFYAVVGTARGNPSQCIVYLANGTAPTASSTRITVAINNTNSGVDSSYVSLVFYGDL
jgi:hypothetical protein